MPGYVPTESERRRRSEQMKLRWQDPEYRTRMLKTLRSDKEMTRRSDQMRDLWKTAEFRNKMVEASRKQWEDPGYVEKITAALAEARGKQRAALQAWWANPENQAKVAEGARRWQAVGPRECAQCRETFEGGRLALRCPKCRNDVAWRHRVLVRLVARDGTLCQLCEEEVDLELSGRHPRGASIDHVIPAGLGGSHDFGNLQLAHRECNRRKGKKLSLDTRPIC